MQFKAVKPFDFAQFYDCIAKKPKKFSLGFYNISIWSVDYLHGFHFGFLVTFLVYRGYSST